MISGIGTDIMEISRVDQAHRRMGWSFVHRTLGHLEIDVYSELKKDDNLFHRPTSDYLARRFAAKEAFIKALGDTSVDMREVQVLNDERGKPHYHFSGNLEKTMRNLGLSSHLSITDNDTTVVAVAILEKTR